MSVIPPEDLDYYADRSYWNALPAVVRYQNRRSTGDDHRFWYDQLRDTHGTFDRALMLNCGNGWVERTLIERGVVRSAVGVDISEGHLREARRFADDADLPIEYVRMDINTDPLPQGDFDLVVNYAAAHHIAYIDRVFRSIAELLPDDGLFVSWDYVGPHRNQYPAHQWEKAWHVNAALPPELRQRMEYPHLPTMLLLDPTEAVHSELILPTMRRYFALETCAPLGGAIGYLLLTHNAEFYRRPYEEVAPHVEMIVAADEEYVTAEPEHTLFAYVVARPDREHPVEQTTLDRWTEEETEREHSGAGHEHYPPTLIASLSLSLSLSQAAHDPSPALTDVPTRVLLRHVASRTPLAPLYRRLRRFARPGSSPGATSELR